MTQFNWLANCCTVHKTYSELNHHLVAICVSSHVLTLTCHIPQYPGTYFLSNSYCQTTGKYIIPQFSQYLACMEVLHKIFVYPTIHHAVTSIFVLCIIVNKRTLHDTYFLQGIPRNSCLWWESFTLLCSLKLSCLTISVSCNFLINRNRRVWRCWKEQGKHNCCY